MKSRRSVIRAILFILRLQRNVVISRNESRRNTVHASRGINRQRCQSTKHRRRSSHKTPQSHRNSAPSSSFPLRSPSIFKPYVNSPQTERLMDFAAFSNMSQPYSVGLDESRGRPLLSVCAGAAHTLASTALLCRQQSLDEPATRKIEDDCRRSNEQTSAPSSRHSNITKASFPMNNLKQSIIRRKSSRALEKVAQTPLLKFQRQGSVEILDRKKRITDENDNKLQRKAVKSNMISMHGAVIAVEQDDDSALRLVLSKNHFDVNATLTSGQYAEHCMRWTLLDVALNLHSVPCISTLLHNGARENIYMNTIERRKNAVSTALESTNEKLESLKSAGHSKENEKAIKNLTAHIEVLQKMQASLEIAKIPSPPQSAKIECNAKNSVAVYITPNYNMCDIVIKYKIEWSDDPDFNTILGTYEECDITKTPIELKIEEEIKSKLSFRVSSCGIHDYSSPTMCNPPFIEISSWMDVDGQKDGWKEHAAALDQLTDEIDRHRQSLVWQRVYPSVEINFKKKKASLKELFSASLKFSKNASRGVFLASIVYTEGKILCTVDDCLPILPIDENVTTLSRDDHHWLMKLSLCWEQVATLIDSSPSAYANNVSLSFRLKFIAAATMMHNALGVRDIGHLHHVPVTYENCIFLVTVKFLDPTQMVTGLTMRWLPFAKLFRKKMASAAVDLLNKETLSIMNFYESCQIPLKRGLYLCYMKLHSTMNTIRVVVPDNLPSMLPFVQVRDNPHVTKEEWEWATDLNEEFNPSKTQLELHGQLSTAIQTLLHDLDIDSDLVPGHRLYHAQILEPSENVSIILVLPRAEDVCSVPSGNAKVADNAESRRCCSAVPIPVFEMLHQCTYQPDFIAMYCRLSIFLEHYTMISHYEQRKCMLENDSKVYKQQLDCLTEYQKRLDEIWKNARWINRIATEARDKHVKVSKNALPLGRLLAPLGPTLTASHEDQADIGYHSDQGEQVLLRVNKPNNIRSIRPHSVMGSPQESYRDIDRLYRRRKLSAEFLRLPSVDSNTVPDRPKDDDSTVGVVTVYSAIEDSDFPKGSSVKLSISGSTSTQEVISLVLEQLVKTAARQRGTMEIIMPDKNLYCLAAVIGARERRLKDDFPLLRLQNPWLKGKLFIRLRDDLLSAISVGNESVV